MFFQPIPLGAPGENADTVRFAQMVARAMGPAYQPLFEPGNYTVAGADAMLLGGVLALGYDANTSSIAEAFPDTVLQLVAEWEVSYGLHYHPSLPIGDRRNLLLAKIRALRGGDPRSIDTSVETIVGVGNCEVWESSFADIPPGTPQTEVYRFAVAVPYVAATWVETLAGLIPLVETMKPAHTTYEITNLVTPGAGPGFFASDPNSLTNLTVLGY